MLYSPHKRFVDETTKQNINTVNSKDYQESMHFNNPLIANTENFDRDETKSANQPLKSHP